MSVIVCGNSHVEMLLGLGDRLPSPNEIFSMGNGKYERNRFSDVDGDSVRMTEPHYAKRLTACIGENRIDASHQWGFVHVNHNSRVYRNTMWRRYEPAAVARGDAVPISRSMVEDILVRDQLGVRTFYDQLIHAHVPFVAISAPPPRRDGIAVDRGNRIEVISYLDSLARTLWAHWLAERNIPLIDVPERAKDSDGFLRKKYWRVRTYNGVKDSHHANKVYGRLLVDDIATHLRTDALARSGLGGDP